MNAEQHNAEAERAVLGSMMISAETIPLVLPILNVMDFAVEKNQQVYRAIRDLHKRGSAADFVTIKDELERTCNGAGPEPAYLSMLNDGLPDYGNITSYVGIVKRESIKRTTAEKVKELAQAVESNDKIRVGRLNDEIRKLQEKEPPPDGNLSPEAEAELAFAAFAAERNLKVRGTFKIPRSSEATPEQDYETFAQTAMLVNPALKRSKVEVRIMVLSMMPAPTFVEVLSRLPLRGDRMKTGVSYIDDALDGGVTGGETYCFTAKTGRGKTALVTQIGLHVAEEYHIPVIGVYMDAGDGYSARMIARQLGFPKNAVLEQSPETIAALEKVCKEKGIELRMLPTTADDVTVEAAEEMLVKAGYGDKPAAIILDSTQEVPSRAGGDGETAQIVNTVRAVHKVVERHPLWFTLSTSEAKRPSKENTDRQSSSSGSKKIEYKHDALFVLEGTIEDGIEITLEKGRFGRRPVPGHLTFDFDELKFNGVGETEHATNAAQKTLDNREATIEKWARTCYDLIQKKPRTATELRTIIKTVNALKTPILSRLKEAMRVTVTKKGNEETYSVSIPQDN